jgi:hypothetical protein
MARAALFHLSLWFDIFATFITRKCVCVFYKSSKNGRYCAYGWSNLLGYISRANTFPPPPHHHYDILLLLS